VSPLLVTNAYLASPLVANGTVTVDVLSGSLSVGQFPLVKYSGTIGGSGGSAFVLGTIEPHAAGYISNNTVNGSIDLVVTSAPQPLHWAVGNDVWDIGLTANWKDNAGNTTTYQQIGSLADNVSFDDSSSGTSPITVTLNASPIPNSVTVTGSKNYTISGSGSISGLGTVTKSGADTLFLQTANSFVGGLNINGGILNFTALTNLGGGPINFGGGTLQYASGTVDDISVRTVTFNAGGGTIDLNGNAVSFANPVGNGGAGGLTVTGGNTLTINQTNRYSGNTVINSGSTLAFQAGANTYISNSAALVVNGTLDVSQNSNPDGFGLTLSTPASQILSGIGTVKGEISMGNGTTISPATNGTYGTLTVAGDLTINGGTLAMDIAGPTGGSKDTLVVTAGNGSGNLTLGSGLNAGTVLVNVAGTLNNGTYPLITYSGSLNGAAGNLNLAGFSEPGHLAYLTSSANTINLVVITGNTNHLVWGTSGLSNNAWDVDNSANWNANGVPGQIYDNGDSVTFDDTGLASSPVNLGNNGVAGSGTIIPGSVVLNVTNNNYTFQDGVGDGSGKLLGATALTINSSAANVTTILTQNGNSGPTTVKGGTLQIGNGGVTGDIGTGNVTNNGTLVFNQTDNRSVQGQVSGTGNLIQEGSANLILMANNSYTGQTIISNASSILSVGTGGAVGTLGTGAIVDNGLLNINRSGSFALSNISGSGSVAFAGSPTISLNSTNAYQGNTFITNGSLKLTASEQIPDGTTVSGSIGIFGLGGTFDLNGFNETVNGLTDLGVGVGMITNGAASGTNVLTIGIPAVNTTNTFSGNIVDNTNRAGIRLVINNPGMTTLTGQGSTFRGGIIVGLGTLQLGQGGPNINGGPAAGTGGILMSNGTTLFLGGNNITFVSNPVTIAPHSTVTLSEQATAAYSDTYSGLIFGDALSTNVIGNQFTAQGTAQWNGFLGTVLVPDGAGLRMYGATGGTNTTFEIDGTGSLFSRNADTITLGALNGNGAISAPSNPGATLDIGSKGVNSTFGGTISGTYNLVKVGSATFTLDGSTNSFTTTINDDGSISTNYFGTNGLAYIGATTVSNGVLAIVAPANLNGTNFTSFALASSTAVLDMSRAGYTPDGVTYVTDSTLVLGSPQTLTGIGTIRGSVIAANGTTVSVGFLPNTNGSPVTGALNITNSIELGGAVILNISATNSPNSGEIVSPTITIDVTATLLVTNIGPGLVNGQTFTLFSQPVTGFASKILPATDPTGTTNYVWADNLGSNGTIQLISGGLPSVATNPTNIMVSVNGGNLSLSWPADHLGWYLQVQTNSLSTGLGTNWVDVPGSSSVTNVVVPVNPDNPTVFYRMSLNP
jgi:fibronectin-binding autotransporter adhesin